MKIITLTVTIVEVRENDMDQPVTYCNVAHCPNDILEDAVVQNMAARTAQQIRKTHKEGQ